MMLLWVSLGFLLAFPSRFSHSTSESCDLVIENFRFFRSSVRAPAGAPLNNWPTIAHPPSRSLRKWCKDENGIKNLFSLSRATNWTASFILLRAYSESSWQSDWKSTKKSFSLIKADAEPKADWKASRKHFRRKARWILRRGQRREGGARNVIKNPFHAFAPFTIIYFAVSTHTTHPPNGIMIDGPARKRARVRDVFVFKWK